MTYRIREQIINTESDGSNAIYYSNPAYAGTGSTVDVYVSTGGNDDTGDGSAGNPYRQIKHVINTLPLYLEKDIDIHVEPGSYDTFQIHSKGPGSVRILASTDNAIATGAFSFSAVAANRARYRGNIGVSTSGITAQTHWVFADLDGIISGLALGGPCLDIQGGVNELDTPGNIDFGLGSTYYIVPFEHTISISSAGHLGAVGDDNISVSVFGFILDRTGSNSATISGLNLYGCRIDDDSRIHNSKTFQSVCVNGAYFSGTIDPSAIGYSVFLDGVVFRDIVEKNSASSPDTPGNSLHFCVFQKNTGYAVKVINSNVGINDIDFDNNAIPFRIRRGGLYLETSGGYITIVGNPSKAIVLEENSIFKKEGAGTISGSTSGTCIELQSGSQAIGIKAACDGNLTSSGGSEIVVGANTGADFSTLPANDSAEADTHFCRAT